MASIVDALFDPAKKDSYVLPVLVKFAFKLFYCLYDFNFISTADFFYRR